MRMDKCDFNEMMDLHIQANFAFYELHLYRIIPNKSHYIQIEFFPKTFLRLIFIIFYV